MAIPALIGITAGNNPESEEYYVLRWDYLRSVEFAGGIPVVLAPSGPALHPSFIDRLDGLVVTGGVDVDPKIYGAPRHPAVKLTNTDRDAFELILVHEALERRIPVLGICRGMQVLNVALGGTLIQDIPTVLHTSINHIDMDRPRASIAHPVFIVPHTRLHRILNHEQVQVNSFHHQAVNELGTGLIPNAYSPDGIIEGIEYTGDQFVMGVQWHPEAFWIESKKYFGPLFREFVQAAEARIHDAGVPFEFA